ncbi:MAG: NAD-dependent epimerase, partial [Magnetovibrio sp.]|nr:NAD-dependent epimerase [Magnetovibrio sp.]
AASSFASGILREPLNGIAANCPVAPATPLWLMSPRRAVEALVRAAELPAGDLDGEAVITLPGLSATPAEMVAALERASGPEVAARVSWRRDPAIEAIVATWPGAFAATRALGLGFRADEDIDSIIRAYMEDDL